MQLSALAIDVAQLLSVTEIALPQTFLCVDRNYIQYDFHGGANSLWHKCRDANLWRPKIGDCLFFTTPPPPTLEFQQPPTPEKLTQPPMGMT